MTDKKISQLTGATTPLAGTEVLPIVQSGATVKVSVADLTAGRTVDATTVNATTVDATNLEVTNVKAKDGTAAFSIADSTGKVTVSSELAVDNLNLSGNAITSTDSNGNIDLTPNGTGEVNITKVDIDAGAIDGTTIGSASAAAGTFTTLTASTLGGALDANNQAITNINVDSGAIDGTPIGANSAATGAFTTATATTGNITTVNATTVDATNVEVTNVKAKDGTAALTIADSTGKVTVSSELAVDNLNLSGNAITSTDTNGNIDLTPDGSGEVNITKVDIDAGTIDGTTIATSDITVGAGKTLNVSAGTLTLANDQISGDSVEGGTINAVTINTLGGTTANVTTVNATTVDATNVETTNLKAKDGTAAVTIADSTGAVTVSTNILVSAGSFSTPSLANSSDTDTGIYFGSGVVNVSTGGALRAQFDGANLSLGGSRREGGYECRYPGQLILWGNASAVSSSLRTTNYKTNVSTGVATSIFTITKAAGSASSDEISQLGGFIRLSTTIQITNGTNITEFVEIPFSLGCVGTGNISLASGTQRVVTSVNNTGGGSASYSLSLASASNTGATLQLTVTRTNLANNYIGIEMDAIRSVNSSTRLMVAAAA